MKKEEKQKAKERGKTCHLNEEVQRTARRDKKAFLSEQCKKVEDNNRMGQTRDLFKKIGAIIGLFHARLVMVKDRNGKDLMKQKRLRRHGKNT